MSPKKVPDDEKKGRYYSIGLPLGMTNKIERLIKRREDLGFTTVPEFVRTAVRKYIDDIEKNEL
jgi:Arc/MetJ-type ribon-helix-helix transcriptional regulator